MELDLPFARRYLSFARASEHSRIRCDYGPAQKVLLLVQKPELGSYLRQVAAVGVC